MIDRGLAEDFKDDDERLNDTIKKAGGKPYKGNSFLKDSVKKRM